MHRPDAQGAVSQANSQLEAPAEQEIRCGLGFLRATAGGHVAVLGLTAASSAALVAELVVRTSK